MGNFTDQKADPDWGEQMEANLLASKRELERLDTEARRRFNNEQAKLREQEPVEPEIEENPRLF